MKQFLALVVLGFMVGCFPTAVKKDYGEMQRTRVVKLTKQEIFDNVGKYIAMSFVDASAAVTHSNERQGLITLRSNIFHSPFPFEDRRLEFKIMVLIKEGAYSVKLTPLRYVRTANNRVGRDFSPSGAQAMGKFFRAFEEELYRTM